MFLINLLDRIQINPFCLPRTAGSPPLSSLLSPLFFNLIVCVFLSLLTSPALSQEEEPAEKWSGLPWVIGPVVKWDGLMMNSSTGQWSKADFLIGLESVYRMDRYSGAGASLYFSTDPDSSLEIGVDYRKYLPLFNDILNPYLGIQLNYLTRRIGGFSIGLRPGIEIITIPQFSLSGFGLVRYDIFESLRVNSFQVDHFTMGLGLQGQYRF